MNATIGEGATTVTPLQLALAYGALGNGVINTAFTADARRRPPSP